MAIMYFKDISDIQTSNIEANIWRIEAAMIIFDHHSILICKNVAIPLPLMTQSSGKIPQRKGYHDLYL